MSSVSWNAGSSWCSQPFPAEPPDKKNIVLNYISASKRLLEVRPASRLEVRPRPEMLSTSIAELDAVTGGIPRGCLSEICGPASSGKTSVLLALMATATWQDEACALIDASDSFDPESGAAAGVKFGKLLWVRCGKSSVSRRSLNIQLKANDQPPKSNGTRKFSNFNEYRLEQVLKITDLVLQSGGFGLVALDLAGIPEKYVRRIPLASWFRFQRAVEHTKTVLLVVSDIACAQTCAAVVLQLSAIHHQPSRKPSLPRIPPHAQLFEGMKIDVELMRMRLERKPAGSVKASFATRAVRTG